MKDGDTTEWAKYIRLQDVYGVTSDLKVYYCNMKDGTILGEMTAKDIDPNQPVNIINNDTNMKQAITSALAKIGISVNDETGITNKDIAKIRELELDGTEVNLSSLKGLSEIRNIQKLTLKNLTLDNLDGLENLTNLYYIFFNNCNIKDYSNLCNDWGLQYIYMYLPTSMSEELANLQVTKLGEGLADANNLNKLTYLGISGYDKTFDEKIDFNGDWVSYKSKLTDISGLRNINDVVQKSVKYLYLNNNSISDFQSISKFTSVYELCIGWNNMINLNGLEEYREMERLWLQNCNSLVDISSLTNCTKISFASITGNASLTRLNGLEGCKDLYALYLWGNSLNDITALKDHTNLYCLYLTHNPTLQNVSTLGTLTGLKQLYLAGTSNMIETEVRDALANPTTHIAENCGANFTIDEKYQIYFLDTISYFDYSATAIGLLHDDDTKINQLKYKKQVKSLNLKGQTELSNAKLQEILSTMTGLEFLNLNGCSQLSSIDFIGKDTSSNTMKVTNLIELDLRGVSSSLTDLSNLNEYGKSIQTLVVDNPDIDVTAIQTAVSTIGKTARTSSIDINSSLINSSFWLARGTIFLGETNSKKYNFNECTDIEYFSMLCGKSGGTEQEVVTTFDFSNIRSDIDFNVYSNANNLTIKLPTNCGIIDGVMNTVNFDLSKSMKIKQLGLQWCSKEKFKNMFRNVNKSLVIEEFCNFRYGPSNLDFLEKIDASKIKKLAFYGENRTNTLVYLNDFSKLNLCTNIKNIQLFANSNLTNLNDLKECKNLTSLDIRFCANLSSLSGIENLTGLTDLYCYDSSISDISAMSNLKNLKYFSINKNNITDIQALEGTIGDDNKLKYTELNLSNNPISGYSETGHDNIETLKILKKAGLVKVNVYKTSFSSNDIAQIIDIFGTDNVTTDKEW